MLHLFIVLKWRTVEFSLEEASLQLVHQLKLLIPMVKLEEQATLQNLLITDLAQTLHPKRPWASPTELYTLVCSHMLAPPEPHSSPKFCVREQCHANIASHFSRTQFLCVENRVED
ncbi:hypothetical protein KFK09_020452 [Dendrobium nobile]|uniref:Uncharacterized protein n=1 Tax=Dendrobium nobile TaxID=94219 RepID=A0A8T3ALD1_DENNO|nr:hypothetical protein KFK09_020452 [Dendrobium nobile]